MRQPTKEVELIIDLWDDMILVKELEKEEQSSGGIVIPGAAQGVINPMGEALVIQVGPGKKDENGDIIPMRLKPGYKILFNPRAGWGILIKGQPHLMMNESGIFCTFETKIKPTIIT